MKWQLLITNQAFVSGPQDTAACTTTFQDEDKTSSSKDGMEHRRVYNLHSEEERVNGIQIKNSLVNTAKVWVEVDANVWCGLHNINVLF